MSLPGNSKWSRRLKISSCGFSSLFVFFGLGLWGFCWGLDFSASLIMIFIKLSGSDSSATRFLDSPCDSFLNSEYLPYKLLLLRFVDQTNCALRYERVVDDHNPFFDTPSMFKKDHVRPSGVERYFIFPRIPPSDDTGIIVFVEFSYIPCCCVFLFVFVDTKDGTSRPIGPFNLYAPIAD